MNRTWATIIAAFAVAVACIAWPQLPSTVVGIFVKVQGPQADPQRYAIIRNEIGKAGDRPIVVFGDSIVQDAPLPPDVCGHRLINAGVGGATIAYFAEHTGALLGTTQPRLIVLAVGINDAWRTTRVDVGATFDQNYRMVVQRLSKLAPVVVATLTGIKDGAFAMNYDPQHVAPINDTIRTTPGTTARIDLDVLFAQDNNTSDGIHLSDKGYAIWSKAILGSIERALNCR
jgi:lysophospholipase L1-like esterase